ncbi:MAG: TfoX/Sxy family protein [Deltaproteobacteria bacterium]|nr:TfoX/Sxy family protein [Deltaproteobacteria bacterium]
MAYDEGLAYRIRERLEEVPHVEKKMFGGVAFMVNGHMSVGIVKSDLMVRLDKSDHDELMERPHVREMDFTGRVMRGWGYVHENGVADDDVLDYWVDRCVTHAMSKPGK